MSNTTTTAFKWRQGFRSNGVAADTAAAEFERLATQGYTTPKEIVAAASDLRSPLNQLFTWDNDAAAERYRLHQARMALRAIEVIHISVVDNTETVVNAMERVRFAVQTEVVKDGKSKTENKWMKAYVPEQQLSEDNKDEIFNKMLTQIENLLTRIMAQFGPNRTKRAIRKLIK